MENTLGILNRSMRAIASFMKIPVIIILMILIAVSVFMIGWLITEALTEHRHLKVVMPRFVDQSNASPDSQTVVSCINESALLRRQKKALTEITAHPQITPLMRESLAIKLIREEKSFYSRRLRVSDFIAKVAPMFGLLGTLIPLGPGIIALGQGDTITLSSSLLTAFDTTILGLIAAAVSLFISSVRSRWYEEYMAVLEAAMECIVEVENRHVTA